LLTTSPQPQQPQPNPPAALFEAPYQHVFGSVGILVLSIASWLDRQLDADGSGYQKF